MASTQRSVWARFISGGGGFGRVALLGLFALLAGCEGEITMDLASELPTDPNITQITANVRGLEFTTSGGGTETLEFRDSQVVEFVDLGDENNVLRLFTNEQLPEGNYTGVRLLFDEDRLDDAAVSTADGRQFPLNVADADYASLSFKVEDNENSSESFTLVLDLRKSLRFDDGNNEYTLTPVMRAVSSEDMGRIDGLVSVTCSAGGELGTGALYLFQGENVTPDDIDGADTEPFATAPIITGQNGSFFYSLRYLPAGNYTLAVTCHGNDEDAAENDDLRFRDVVNVQVDERESVTRDLP